MRQVSTWLDMEPTSLAGLNILILEDEILLRKQMAAFFQLQGADATGAGTLASARQLLQELPFDFVILDVNLPDGLGTDLLKNKSLPEGIGAIVMTANANISGAVDAIRSGALDYLVKPFDIAELPLVISRAQKSRQSARVEEHRREDQTKDGFFFGTTLADMESQLQKILAADRRLQGNLPPVLIQGETGTGKTTIARWLHHNGPRSGQPLIEVNCSALPETLAESELFGHERGAFTDARTTRMGLFEAAQGGTLFLDELPSLSFALQAKVLTAIEDHRIRRVGGNRPITVDARLIAATNKDLKQAVTAGQFREDLYHRLDLYRIAIPPLRERGDDILKLTEIFMERLCRRHRLPRKQIREIGRSRLLRYPWPGNVRELAHELERAIVFEESEELRFESLVVGGEGNLKPELSAGDWFNPAFLFPDQGFQLEEAINRLIKQALKQSAGNVSAAARLLGVTRDYIRYRLGQEKT